MPGSSAFSFLRTLCSLRWLAIAGQAATILVASAVLGLALSHATVEQLGGEMTMTAADGGGTRIRFYLPLGTPGT